MKENNDVKEKIRQLGEELIKYDLKSANKYYYLKGVSREFNRFILFVFGFWVVMNLLPFVAKYVYPPAANYKVDTLSQCIVGGLFFLLVILEIRARFNVKKQHTEAETMLAKRESIIAQLNEYKSHCQKQNIADWWNYIDGFWAVFEARKMNKVDPSYKFHEYCISHTPFERLQKDEDNIIHLRLQPMIERQVTGSDVFQLCTDPNLRMIYNAGIEENKSYGLAEFIFYEHSERVIKKYSTLSEGDIQAEISSFRSEIDSREKFLNTLEGQFSTTNKERLFEGSMSQEQYDSRAFKRKGKEIDFEENLRKNKEVYIGNQLERLAIVSPIGIAIVDEDGLYRGLFLYREMPQRKMYYLGDFKSVRRCLELIPYDADTIFHKFFLMSFGGGFDVAQERPANFTDREWAYWVYAQYYKA